MRFLKPRKKKLFSNDVSARKGDEMREPCAVKVARTVLGRRRQSNLLLLFDRFL